MSNQTLRQELDAMVNKNQLFSYEAESNDLTFTVYMKEDKDYGIGERGDSATLYAILLDDYHIDTVLSRDVIEELWCEANVVQGYLDHYNLD